MVILPAASKTYAPSCSSSLRTSGRHSTALYNNLFYCAVRDLNQKHVILWLHIKLGILVLFTLLCRRHSIIHQIAVNCGNIYRLHKIDIHHGRVNL